MPIKDQQTRREYFKNYMANKRKGLTANNQNFKTFSTVLNPPVKPSPLVSDLDESFPPCSRCDFWKGEIEGFVNLARQAEAEAKEQKRNNHQLIKQIQQLEKQLTQNQKGGIHA